MSYFLVWGLCKVRTGLRRMTDEKCGWKIYNGTMQMIKSLWGKINLRCFLKALFVNEPSHLIEIRAGEVQYFIFNPGAIIGDRRLWLLIKHDLLTDQSEWVKSSIYVTKKYSDDPLNKVTFVLVDRTYLKRILTERFLKSVFTDFELTHRAVAKEFCLQKC